MSRIAPPPAEGFDVKTQVLIIGAGACGLVAALACRELGAECVVLERDRAPAGSTALSAGLIPAAGTRFQRQRGVQDSPALLAADVQRKAKGRADPLIVAAVADAAASTVEWLVDSHRVALDLLDDFLYPGHSALRMHGVPARSGADLIAMLARAAEAAEVPIVTQATAETLFVDGDRVIGVAYRRPDGLSETIGCQALVLACNGYGGAKDLVAAHIPEMADALYFGHVGNQGDALRWGEALGGVGAHLSAYQGHGSVAHPHGILITWATVMGGGFQVNAEGRRFSDETHGYSEQAVAVLAQPGGVAWTIFDEAIAATARQFQDFRDAEEAGAILAADDLAGLAAKAGLPVDALALSFDELSMGRCPWGRAAPSKALESPLRAVRVTGALFHTQGGLRIDSSARALRADASPLPNLFAGGGAACGVSGPAVDGYLSGNGLLTAVALGRIAGAAAATLALS
jgi:fumarate reductase flavoprotein subunit